MHIDIDEAHTNWIGGTHRIVTNFMPYMICRAESKTKNVSWRVAGGKCERIKTHLTFLNIAIHLTVDVCQHTIRVKFLFQFFFSRKELCSQSKRKCVIQHDQRVV